MTYFTLSILVPLLSLSTPLRAQSGQAVKPQAASVQASSPDGMDMRQQSQDQLSIESDTGITPVSFPIHATEEAGQPTVPVLGSDLMAQSIEVSPKQAPTSDIHFKERTDGVGHRHPALILCRTLRERT